MGLEGHERMYALVLRIVRCDFLMEMQPRNYSAVLGAFLDYSD